MATAAGVNMTSTTLPDGFGAAFGDYDLDGDLDLFVTAWMRTTDGNRLFRNNGDGTFSNVWGPCGECNGCPADLDGDCVVGIGDLLILLANWG